MAHELLGVCGLYCGSCYHYQALSYAPERLSAEAARRGRPVEGFTCRGCRSDQPYIHAHCAHCALRACADGRGIAHCGLCAEFPCERLRAFQSDGRVHHRDIFRELETLREQGAEVWLAAQAQRWQCACGEPFSWYDETCHHCGAALASYGSDPTIG